MRGGVLDGYFGKQGLPVGIQECLERFHRGCVEYAIQAPHHILSRDAEALEKAQKLALMFVKGHRHVTHETALQQFRLFSFMHL